MALIDRFFKSEEEFTEPVDPEWSQSSMGYFHRFLHMRPFKLGLADKTGVFVIWHRGVRPGWVYVGKSDDLAVSLDDAMADSEIGQYEDRGKLYCSYAFIRPEFQDRVVCFLVEALQPKVQDRPFDKGYDKTAKHIPVYAPGFAPEGPRHQPLEDLHRANMTNDLNRAPVPSQAAQKPGPAKPAPKGDARAGKPKGPPPRGFG